MAIQPVGGLALFIAALPMMIAEAMFSGALFRL
jgi:hypothetical protein